MRKIIGLLILALIASVAAAQYAQLTWDPVTGAGKYRIYKGLTAEGAALYDSLTGSPPDTAYIDTVLAEMNLTDLADSTYYYKVQAVPDVDPVIRP